MSIIYQEKLFNAYKDLMATWLTLVKKYQFQLQPFHTKPSILSSNIYLLLPLNLCCGYSKELLHVDNYFKYLQHTVWRSNKDFRLKYKHLRILLSMIMTKKTQYESMGKGMSWHFLTLSHLQQICSRRLWEHVGKNLKNLHKR